MEGRTDEADTVYGIADYRSAAGRGLDHCVVTAASAMSAKCELNIGKIRPYETYHAASMSRPRRRPCSRQTTITGPTEAESADPNSQGYDHQIAAQRNMSKMPLDGYAIRRPLQVQFAFVIDV
jgi:hypothetical protein